MLFKNTILLISLLQITFTALSQKEPVDYSNPANWAVVPGNYPEKMKDFFVQDPFDSIDVFYLYPTLIVSEKDTRWNVPIDDKEQQGKILNSVVPFQASAWASSGSLYVPYYRQAHLRSYFNLDSGGREALLFAYADVKAAFEYYLEHFNNGRGIILAGHSQGSTHLSFILRDFFDGKPLQNQLVSAFLPGNGFEPDLYKTIPLMVHPDDIGGFVSWNTFKKKLDAKNYSWCKGKVAINPVTWDTTLVAPRELHKGFLFSNGKMYEHSFTTNRENGVIWITTPHFPYRYMSFTMNHYHVGDVNLFWEDIRQNSILRTEVFLKKRKEAFLGVEK
ncbi:MAG: hypothetical protein RI883_89 [Bacteroidota bacterium]|jgi:hypothetical protein